MPRRIFRSARLSCAGELDGFEGRLESNRGDAVTYTWGLEYREPLTDHINAGFLWLNEGHLPNNHRDGQALQLWWHSKSDPLGLAFEAGIGAGIAAQLWLQQQLTSRFSVGAGAGVFIVGEDNCVLGLIPMGGARGLG